MGVRWQSVISSLGRSSAQTPAPKDVEDQYWTYFGFIVVAALLMRLACYTGLIASDDVGYSHFAQLIAQLHYKPELHHYALRYGLIIPLGALYALFGVREWTTVLLPILASAASVPAVMLIADKLLGRRVALLTGLLVATFPLALRYATILFPEPIAEFYGLVAILIYLYWGTRSPAPAGLICGICVGVAYLTKEPTLFIAPALMIDALAMRRWRLFLGISAGIVMMVGIEHTYYLAVTGDLLFRPHAMIVHNHTVEAVKANRYVFWRLFKAYPRILIVPTLSSGLHSLFALLLVVPACLLMPFEKLRIPLLWVVLPLLYLEFGTSSFTHYWLLPAEDRYLIFIYPPLFMLASAALIRWGSLRPRAVPFLSFVFTLVVVSGFGCGFATRARDWRTDAVRELRIIGKRAGDYNVHSVAFAGDQPEEWRQAMGILNHKLQISTDPKTADITIIPNAFGQPSLLSK